MKSQNPKSTTTLSQEYTISQLRHNWPIKSLNFKKRLNWLRKSKSKSSRNKPSKLSKRRSMISRRRLSSHWCNKRQSSSMKLNLLNLSRSKNSKSKPKLKNRRKLMMLKRRQNLPLLSRSLHLNTRLKLLS